VNDWAALFYMFLGWLLVFAVKYVIVGLAAWDKFFHPERYAADTTGPYRAFAKPFLGVFSCSTAAC
jgi:hypothetical protein